MKSSLLLLCLSLCIVSRCAQADDACEAWFLKSKLVPGTESCEINCATLPFDMGTFQCSAECESFCKTYVKPDTIASLASYVEARSLNPSERALIAKFPLDAIKVYRAKQIALNSTRRIFSNNFRNDESDAYRHFVWSGLMREQIGRDRAQAFLDAHESSSLDPANETKMDKFNNSKGIEAAENLMNQKSFSQERIEQEALNQLQQKKLNVISPEGKVPQWKK